MKCFDARILYNRHFSDYSVASDISEQRSSIEIRGLEIDSIITLGRLVHFYAVEWSSQNKKQCFIQYFREFRLVLGLRLGFKTNYRFFYCLGFVYERILECSCY